MKFKAQDEYVVRIKAVMELLGKLTVLASNHFDINPDAINWGHVGDIGRIEQCLKDALMVAGVKP